MWVAGTKGHSNTFGLENPAMRTEEDEKKKKVKQQTHKQPSKKKIRGGGPQHA
jgi:hypothetical protein